MDKNAALGKGMIEGFSVRTRKRLNALAFNGNAASAEINRGFVIPLLLMGRT